jgi:hypothetical protein
VSFPKEKGRGTLRFFPVSVKNTVLHSINKIEEMRRSAKESKRTITRLIAPPVILSGAKDRGCS